MTRTSLIIAIVIGSPFIVGCQSLGGFLRGSKPSESLAAKKNVNPPKAKTEQGFVAKPATGSSQTLAGSKQPAANQTAETQSSQSITRLAAFQVEENQPKPAAVNQLPPPTTTPEQLPPPANSRTNMFSQALEAGVQINTADPLQLGEVIQSVAEAFPLIQSALVEGQVADGKQISAFGEFDFKLKAESLNMPRGYYKNYRHAVKGEQGTWMGGTVYGQYRLGDGDFQPWYGERETNEGGEVKVGLISPLLRDRQIDERRAEISKANLARAAVEPAVQEQMLDSVQIASNVYWTWVAAGMAVKVNRDLLNLTRGRNQGFESRVKRGDLPLVELQQNERLIAAREAKLIEAQRKLQSAAIKLSIFYRDENGRPMIPPASVLPKGFPPITAPTADGLQSDINRALTQRPELRSLSILRQQVEVDIDYNQNQLLPNLSAVMDASKDMGQPASTKGDKTPFELEAGLMFDMPIQRRKALGKIQSAQGKITQVAWKQQLTENKIRAEVQDAVSAITAAYERVEQLQRSADFAERLVIAERRSFELGNSDLLRVALQEAAALDAELLTIDATADYFRAIADYRAALGEQPIGP